MKRSFNLPIYKSHKTVKAVKMIGITQKARGIATIHSEQFPDFDTHEDFMSRYQGPIDSEDANDFGYYVEYKDGYQSWSPSKVFEEGNTRIDVPEFDIVIVPGHKYRLQSFENREDFQTVRFIHKEPIKGATELETVSDGTTNEAMLEVLIDRMKFLQDKFPCKENAIVITNLEESLMCLEKRTKDRITRGVEGENLS